MSAPINPTITTIMEDFLKEVSATDLECKNNYLAMIERGASAIINSYCLAFYDSPDDTSCANEAASTAASRFIQFLKQAQKEGGDATILSQALPFSLKGRTNSKIIGTATTVSKVHQAFIKKLLMKQLDFIDLVYSYLDSPKELEELQKIFANHWQIVIS